MTAFSIRPYQPDDRGAVFCIAADTAYFGEPVEAFLEDRNVFLDAFYAYYTDLEPEHAWVACADGEVVGFLTGCTDGHLHQKGMAGVIVPRMAGKLVRGRYRLGKKTCAYLAGLLGNLLSGASLHTDEAQYPAHLHVNLAAAWRGHGLGKRLIEAYLGQLQSLGVCGVHLHTTSRNEAACRMYENAGFHIQDARKDRWWSRWFHRPVEARCYGLALG